MVEPEIYNKDNLLIDPAKILRAGGVATFALAALCDGIDSLEIAVEALTHHPVADTVIELAEMTGLGIAGLLMATVGAKALNRVLQSEHS